MPRPITEEDLAEARDRLTAQLRELERRAALVLAEERRPANPDWTDNAAEHAQDEVLTGEDALIASEIASTRRALARIAAGSYGLCVRCGHAIAPARLAARPEAAMCIDCATNTA